MLAAASRDYSSAFGVPAVPLAPFVYAAHTLRQHDSEINSAPHSGAALPPQHPARAMPGRQKQARASTAAQMQRRSGDATTAAQSNNKQRPASGPLGSGDRSRNLHSPPSSLMQTAQQAWAQVTPTPPAHSFLAANDIKKPTPQTQTQPQPQMRAGPPTPQMQRAPLSTHVSARTKARPASLSPPLSALRQQPKGRPRPARPLDSHAHDTEKMPDTPTVSDHILAVAAPLYSILSPTHGSMHAAASAASSVAAQRPSRPGVFDPFLCMYSNSPDYLVSLPVKRAVVGKLSCKQPGGLLHCLRDRLAYMFFPNVPGANAHSPNPHESTQIMMELAWNDVAEVRYTPPAANAAAASAGGSFSFKIHHHLPAFDSFGDYEPHLRNHRITFDFSSQQELAKFRQMVLPLVQAQAIRR